MANFPAEFIEALKTDEAAEWDFAHGGLFAYFEKRGDAWADKIIAQAVKEKWGDLALQRILLSLPKTEHFIECAAKIGGSVEAAYWTKLEIFQINVPAPSDLPWLNDCSKPSGHGQRLALQASMSPTFLRVCSFRF